MLRNPEYPQFFFARMFGYIFFRALGYSVFIGDMMPSMHDRMPYLHSAPTLLFCSMETVIMIWVRIKKY